MIGPALVTELRNNARRAFAAGDLENALGERGLCLLRDQLDGKLSWEDKGLSLFVWPIAVALENAALDLTGHHCNDVDLGK